MAGVKVDDIRQLVRTHTRVQFIELCTFPFLVGTTQLSRPHQPGRTVLVSAADREGMLSPRLRPPSGSNNLMVLPVRKIQEAFPSMITVGRTNNNDVVIEDIQVSKFHAFFRVSPERLELADAGSRNGTFINGTRLETKGSAKPVRNGESVRFGRVELVLVDAGACWDRLH
jgi:FHA domain